MKRMIALLSVKRVGGIIALSLATSAAAQDPLAPLPDRPLPNPVVPAAVQPAVTVHRYSAPVTGFESYKQRLAGLARTAGIRPATIANVIPYLTLNTTAMRLDRAQPGNINNPNYTPPFAPYRRRHVTADLIRRGQANYRTYWPWLSRIEQQYGVPASIMLAIWGKETSYGRIKGTFDVPQALASLGYEGRRRALFESEFIAALRLLDQGVPRANLRGSYAGAMGHPQFMPTNVLRLRADGDGDGDRDIWGSPVDGLASIGNYLRNAGWKRNVLWGVPVSVPATLNRASVRQMVPAAKCPRVHARHSRPLTFAQWKAMGVRATDRSLNETDMATLIEPDGPYATAYLVTDNYRAVLDYNCSNFYALSVTLLADRIIGR